MSKTLQTVIDDIYMRLGQTQESAEDRWNIANLTRMVNDGFRQSRQFLMQNAPSLFVMQLSDVELTLDTEYVLAQNILSVNDIETTVGEPIPKWHAASLGSRRRRIFGYEQQGRSLFLRNRASATVNIRYIQDWSDLHFGNAEATFDDTAIVLATTPAGGERSVIDDIYNRMRFEIHDAASDAAPKGEIKTITDFVGSTRTVTLDSALTAVVAATTEYSIMPPWPGMFDELLVLEAIARIPEDELAIKSTGRQHYTEMRAGLIEWASKESANGFEPSRALANSQDLRP